MLNNALWVALFNPPGSIQYAAREAYESTLTTTPIVSYPADQVASFLQNTYTNLAINSPTAYPSLDTLASFYGGLGYANRDGIEELEQPVVRSLSNERLGTFQTAAGPPPYYNDWTGASAQTALAALRFYHMVANQGMSQAPPAVALPTVDFHRALTFIGEHPTLQRALGLVFDVVRADRAICHRSPRPSTTTSTSARGRATSTARSPTAASGVTYQRSDAADAVQREHRASSRRTPPPARSSAANSRSATRPRSRSTRSTSTAAV